MATLDRVALALSDPIRLSILDLLIAGRFGACCSPDNPDAPAAVCSCDIMPKLNLAPSRLSYHMRELKEAGLVQEQKRGRWVYFSVDTGALAQFQQELSERFLKASGCCTPLIQVDTGGVEGDQTGK